MSLGSVYVTRRIPQAGLDLVATECDVTLGADEELPTKEEVIEGVRGKDALLCLLTETIDGEVMDAAPDLKVISNYAVGFNNVDVEAATARGIAVCNTPGVLTDTTADLAWTLMMAIARRIPEADRYTREGRYKGWGPLLLLGTDISGKTLGILGLGRIGAAVAKRAVGFDMKVQYYDAIRHPETEKELGVEYVDFDTLLATSDFITVHVPLMDETHHVIDAAAFAKMKNSAFLINTSRGPVVDEKALVKALQDKSIQGAALDVFEEEPELAPGLAELDNVVITPHVASGSVETRTKMATLAAENLLAVLKGQMPKHIVNPEVLK